jgi:hypothetical protein
MNFRTCVNEDSHDKTTGTAADFLYFSLRGTARRSFLARIGRAPFYRARSASKKDGLAVPLLFF